MYLLDAETEIVWEIGATTSVVTLSSLDLRIVNPEGFVTYLDSPIEAVNFTAPTKLLPGSVSYSFTPDVEGLWKICLVKGTKDSYIELSEVDMQVFGKSTHVNIITSNIINLADLHTFTAVMTPFDYITTNTIYCDNDFEVNWGNGVWVKYNVLVTGYIVNSVAIRPLPLEPLSEDNGLITVRDNVSTVTYFKLLFNTYTSCIITKAGTLTNGIDLAKSHDKLVTFNIFGGSNILSLKNAFSYCTSLTAGPVNASFTSCLDLEEAWYSCDAMKTFTSINAISATTIKNTWTACVELTSFSSAFSSALDASGAWGLCLKLKTCNTALAACRNFNNTWKNCSVIEYIEVGATAGATWDSTFYACYIVSRIKGITTIASGNVWGWMFYACYALEDPWAPNDYEPKNGYDPDNLDGGGTPIYNVDDDDMSKYISGTL